MSAGRTANGRPVDGARFPRLARYLRGLPEGLASHADCTSKASGYRSLIDTFDFGPDREHLPAPMVALIDDPVPVSAWIPSTIYNAFFMVAVDRHFGGKETDATEWYHELRAKMFRSPLYRVLMVVVSPRSIFKSAGRRWENFHRGTTLEIEYDMDDATWARGTLGYPQNLQTPLTVEMLTQGLRAALEAAGAKDIEWEIESVTPTAASMFSRWS